MILNISNGFRKFFMKLNERSTGSIKYDQKKKIIKTTIYNDATIAVLCKNKKYFLFSMEEHPLIMLVIMSFLIF